MKVDPGLAGRLDDQETRFGCGRRRPAEVVLARGDGVHVWDVQDRRYLDCLSARTTPSQGHTHTRIATTMVDQCLRLPMAARHDRLPPLLEKLCTLTGFDAALPLGGEAAALEAAILAARGWGVRHKGLAPGEGEVLVFPGNDHAHPASLLGLSGGPEGFGPFLPGFITAAYGIPAAARERVGPRTCAVLVEPVLGRGLALPPKGFLRSLRELCDAEGLLLLVDEGRSGLCRTGKLFAFEHEGIRPDGVVLGPSLAGGFHPAGAFLASRKVMDLVPPGLATADFSPVACAVASAALDVLVEERLSDRAAELGAYFLAQLRAMDSPRVRDIRGLGLWAALELADDGAEALCGALAQEGLLCEPGSARVVTLAPPLVVTREQLDWAVDRLEAALAR